MFAGIDWASEEHAVCVHDDAGRDKAAWAIAHSADGFEDLVRRLARFGDPAELPVAIERPDGRLRALVRARGDLVTQRVATNNQLEATLDAFWPGAKAVFADVTSKIALAFLERYPTPASAAGLGEKRMAAFCAKHGYSGRRSPAELIQRLRGAPAGIADGAESTARKDVVLASVRVLRGLSQAHRRPRPCRDRPTGRAPRRRGLH